MFCFGRGGAAERQAGGALGPGPLPAPATGNAEDLISDISSDGKYEIDIPTPEEFTLANAANMAKLRYIDSDKQDGDSSEAEGEPSEGDRMDDEVCPSANEVLLIRDTAIKIAPAMSGLFEWGSSKSLNNGGSPPALGPGPGPRIIDNLSRERVGARGPASSADLADRLGSQLLYSRQSSEESTRSTCDNTNVNTTDHSDHSDHSPLAMAPPPGPRFKLLPEGDIQVCQLNHTRTLISKMLSSKFLRRWETHHLYLGSISISSRTPCVFLEPPLPYTRMEEVYSISRWDAGYKYCLRIVVRDGSLLLQAKNAYTRDQWFHSIQWKRNLYKYRNILLQSTRKEVVLKELRNMVDYVMSTPLQDESITSEPLEIISQLLAEEQRWSDGDDSSGAALREAGPLLAAAPLGAPLAAALARHCRARPRSPRLRDTLALVASRILKHNVDFGKAPHLRRLVQEYISALNHQNGGEEVVHLWVRSVHGAGPFCPHPRVLPNLAAACLAALHQPPPPHGVEENRLTPSPKKLFTLHPSTPHSFPPNSSPAIRLPPLISITSSPPSTPIIYSSPAISVGYSPPATPVICSLPATPTYSLPATPNHCSAFASSKVSPSTPATYSLHTSFRSHSPTETLPMCSPLGDPGACLTPSNLANIPVISCTLPSTPTKENDLASCQDEEEIHNNNIFHMTTEMKKNKRNDPCSQYSAAEEMKVTSQPALADGDAAWTDDTDLICFAKVIKYMSEYEDWAEGLGALLQPVPVPSRALEHPEAGRALAAAALALGRDSRCAVHRRVLPLRPPRPGWLHLLCPTEPGAHPDHAQLWGDMLEALLNCCCKRKRFLTELTQMLPACLLLALRAHPAGLESLCLMLEWELLGDEQQRLEAVQALRSSAPGRRALHQTCQKQVHLKKLQQKGGPRRLTLPSRATDADVARLLSAGSFGNLECLSLAFTHVTSAVAEQLIKLPSLRYLNLWATQFGDAGVLLIAEHLQHLQVLNLCETPVSDNGIAALAGLPSLRKLNLNSTKLTAATWARLRPCLPALQESDVRYTDAW